MRNLGLMVKTGGYMLDVSLMRAIDQGWVDGPRIIPAGHAITPYGGHLDPQVFQRIAPGIMPLSVFEGIANGVSEVRALRPLPDPPRRQGDQGLRVGWRDVAQHRAGRAAVLRRGVRGDRRRGTPGGDPGGRARSR